MIGFKVSVKKIGGSKFMLLPSLISNSMGLSDDSILSLEFCESDDGEKFLRVFKSE